MTEMICIACPLGCRLQVEERADGEICVTGNTCRRGVAYGKQEYTCPMRTVTSSVLVQGGERPLCAVKTAQPVPKAAITQVLEEIRKIRAQAPLKVGQVVVENIAQTGVALVATAELAQMKA